MLDDVKRALHDNPLQLLLPAASFAFLLFTMLHNLTFSPLWGDEWAEMTISSKAFGGEMYAEIIGTFQPPLYNWLMHFWLMISRDMWWFRFFNVIAGLVGGAFAFRTVSRLASVKAASFTLIGLACCYEWIYCVQEASEYTLMLMFLFMTLSFFVELADDFSTRALAGFVVGCAGAMYSQYGAAFVVVPCIVMAPIFAWRQHGRPALQRVVAAYGIALLVFAAPLYFCFLRNQLGNMQGGGDRPAPTLQMLLDFPFVFGQMVGYFFHQSSELARVVWSVVSVCVLAASVWMLTRKETTSGRRALLISLLVAYVLHYPLVCFHVYAMVHPEQSYGFFCRYSYFYLPLLVIVLPVLAHALFANAREAKLGKTKRGVVIACACAGVACLAISLVALLGNWHKSYDDEFARVWIENEGWRDTTCYMGAYSKEGMEHYVRASEGFEESWLDNCVDNYEVEPVTNFWVWHDNWDWDDVNYARLLNYAEEHGYHATYSVRHNDPIDYKNHWSLIHYER